MNRIRQVETGDLLHAVGKENESSRVILVVTVINAIEACAVEILLALKTTLSPAFRLLLFIAAADPESNIVLNLVLLLDTSSVTD